MASASTVKPALHIEVRLKSVGGAFVRTDLVREEVLEWLSKTFIHLKIDSELKNYDALPHAYLIESINVVDFGGSEGATSYHRLNDVQLDVQAYELREEGEGASAVRTHEGDDDDALLHVRVTPLPSKSLNGVWESLVFDGTIPSRLLRFITRMSTSKHQNCPYS